MKKYWSMVCLLCISLLFVACSDKENLGTKTKGEKESDIATKIVAYSDQPTLEMIPDSEIAGQANGVDFEAKAVYFELSFGNWSMVIADKELDSPTDILMGAQSVKIELDTAPKSGDIFSKDMAYGDGYFQIRKKDDPENTTSWNSDNAYVLEITKWEVKEYDPEGDIFQEAGKASGKVFVAYSAEGWDEFENSWLAGSFTDVPIRYMWAPDEELKDVSEESSEKADE